MRYTTTLYDDSFFRTPFTQYYYCHYYVVLSNDSMVWSGLDMWAAGGGCVGQLSRPHHSNSLRATSTACKIQSHIWWNTVSSSRSLLFVHKILIIRVNLTSYLLFTCTTGIM